MPPCDRRAPPAAARRSRRTRAGPAGSRTDAVVASNLHDLVACCMLAFFRILTADLHHPSVDKKVAELGARCPIVEPGKMEARFSRSRLSMGRSRVAGRSSALVVRLALLLCLVPLGCAFCLPYHSVFVEALLRRFVTVAAFGSWAARDCHLGCSVPGS